MALSKILENSITDGVVSSAKLKDFTAAVDLNGVELILDADQDTSITADTDDRIDFKIANTDHISIGTSSGDTVIKPMTDAKDIIFQQYDGNKILEINDGNYVGIGGNAAGAGELRIYEDTDNGTHYTGFKAGNNTASVAYVLPTADGSSGQALQTDGSGTLSWGTAGTITSYTNSTNNRVVTSVDSSTINSEANLTFDGSTLAVTGAVTVSTNLDVDGTANLDAVDIDGAVQLDATLTVGANDQGYDVILYGDTASANVTWDTSADDLIFNGAAGLIVPDGQLTLGSTAVTSTAAELNLLDGVSGLVQADLTKLAAVDSTAAELNIVDGGTSATATTLADADRLVVNDNGTMVQVALTDFETYFESALDTLSNVTTVGALNSGSITSGFGSIDNGSSAITTTGTITGGVVVADDVSIDGKAITMTGSSSDTFVVTVGTNGATSLVTTDDSAAAANMTITADGTMEIDGTTITLDSSGDIVLDADGADIIFKDAGTTIATHTNSSSDYVITTGVQDKDFVIKGNDGGSTITPFTLDMSAGGDLFLTGGLIDLKNNGSNVSQIKFYCEASNAHAQTLIGAPHSESATNTLTLPSTGGNSYLVSAASTATLTNKTLTTPVIAEIDATGDFILDAVGDITLDADGGEVRLKDAGTTMATLGMSSSNFTLESNVSDKDIIFKGNDGGSSITALTLDMSDAGTATFNHDIIMGNDNFIKSSSSDAGSGIKMDAGGYTNITFDDDADLPGFRVQQNGGSYGGNNQMISSYMGRNGVTTSFPFTAVTNANASPDIEWYVRSDGQVAADGSFSGGGADYAEFFEWKDGNSSDEDRRGYSVVLDGDKIVKATDGQTPIGVISGRPAVVGDSDILHKWKSKYLTDDYGSPIMETYTIKEWTDADGNNVWYETDKVPDGVTVPDDAVTKTKDDDNNTFTRKKLNPDWNKDTPYVMREFRKEWDTVGLMGKLRIRKGQPTASNWIKMRDVSDAVEEWLIR